MTLVIHPVRRSRLRTAGISLSVLTLLFSVSSGVVMAAESTVDHTPVIFKDPALEQLIRSEVNIYDDNPIYPEDMQEIVQLHASSYDIADLSGLEYAANLEYIFLESNRISDVTPLSQLPKLTSLSISQNQITDLSPLGNLPQLTELSAGSNPLNMNSSLYGLSKLPTLRTLILSGAQSTVPVDLTPLASMKELRMLYLSRAEIRNPSALSKLNKLERLNLAQTGLNELTSLASLKNLTELLVDGNQIEDLSPLASLKNLETLGLGSNGIRNLSPLASLSKLQTVDLSNNRISDLKPLGSLKNLQSLSFPENQVTTLQPLVENSGIGQDDYITADANYLDLTPGSAVSRQIEALAARGAVVSAESQREPQDTLAPQWQAKSRLKASEVTSSTASLQWSKASDDTAVTAYRIYANGQLLGETGGDTLQYPASGLTAGISYTFSVQAGDAAGNWSMNGPETRLATKATRPVLSELHIHPAKDSVQAGKSTRIRVKATLSDGSSMNRSRAEITFKSAAPHIASVDDQGKLEGLAEGTAQILVTVTYEGVTKSETVTIEISKTKKDRN